MSVAIRGARHYPSELLAGCEDALILFAAGFYGRNDGAWVAEAGMDAVCVDTDAEKLAVMRRMYPETWEFVCMDAFAYAEQAQAERRSWDLVSIDCPSDLIRRCREQLPLFCSLARKLVIVTSDNTVVEVPGFEWDLHHRVGDVYWLSLERQ